MSLSAPSASARRALGFSFFTLALVLSACSGGPGQQQGAGGPPGGMVMPVGTLTVEPVTAPIYAEAVGQTEGAREVEVRARVNGLLLTRNYEEGAPVKAGQALFQIDRAPLEAALASARAAVAQAKARADQATRELNRLKGLVEQDAASRKDLDDAMSNDALARAALEASQAQQREAELNLGYANVTAPIGGISGRAQKADGNLISAADNLLTTVVQVDPIKVRFALSEADAATLPGGKLDASKVKSVQIIPAGSDKPLTGGKLDFTASIIDPRLGTRSLRAAFANPDAAVMPGQFVKVRLEVGAREGVFRIPQAAVIQTDQGFVVMTVGEGDKVAPRPIQPGNWDGKDWIILGGLKAGDRVIVDNLIKVRPGMQVKPVPPGAAGPQGAPAGAKKG